MACNSETQVLSRRSPLDTAASQIGMTPINTLVVIALVGFSVFLVFKVAPVFIESYAVSDAIASLKKDFRLRERSEQELYALLLKRFHINDVKHITYKDIRKKIKIKKTRQLFIFTVNYNVVVPLFKNISLLFDVHKEIKI